MKLDNVFKKRKIEQEELVSEQSVSEGPKIPAGLLKKCNHCKAAIIAEDVKRDYYICPKCGEYFHIPSRARLAITLDEGTFEEWDPVMPPVNPMEYKGYPEKVAALQEKTGLNEAVITGKGSIDGQKTAIGICDGRFLMASMGYNVGEKITKMVERATEERLPVIIFCCSGGARMQEGIVSLMQMAKTSAALKRHSDAGLLYISVLTDPTTGGVTASFAMLGDIILAEPKALIGFAGPRVIEQTMKQKLPKGFQRSEFLLEHGFVDEIVERSKMKEALAAYLHMHSKEARPEENIRDINEASVQEKMCEERKLSAWDRVLLSRQNDRPVGTDYIELLFTDFRELHGDRQFGDDGAIVGGVAMFHGRPVTVIVQEKGKTTKENIARGFGMPKPEGYRKALRLMKQAEKFHRPVFCIVDTPGAFCGMEAEERGQGEAIARNLWELSSLKTPVLTVVTGEGGSGGALAMAVADEVWMLENATYSILSPEGFASILWKDAKKADEAAKAMKLTAGDVLKRGVIERVIPEPEELTRETLPEVTAHMEPEIEEFFQHYENMSETELLNHRYSRFREM